MCVCVCECEIVLKCGKSGLTHSTAGAQCCCHLDEISVLQAMPLTQTWQLIIKTRELEKKKLSKYNDTVVTRTRTRSRTAHARSSMYIYTHTHTHLSHCTNTNTQHTHTHTYNIHPPSPVSHTSRQQSDIEALHLHRAKQASDVIQLRDVTSIMTYQHLQSQCVVVCALWCPWFMQD